MRIAYVVYGEILAPVVRSQTLPLLAGLAALGHEPHLVVVESPRRFLRRGAYAEALRAAREVVDGRLKILTHLPRHAGPGLTARRAAKELSRIRPDVVHARQSRAAVAAGRSGRWPLLLDMRGIRPEEFLLSRQGKEEELTARDRRILGRLRREDRAALERAGAVVCVSEPFRRRLGSRPDCFVVPNAGEPVPALGRDGRETLRERVGVPGGGPVFVYSGSLAPWQCAADAVALFSAIREVRKDVRLVMLTHDLEGGQALVDQAGAGDTVVLRLTPEETRRTLAAFDVALLLRERDPVNSVASPVKLAEYLHAGLPVVLTEGIGDASRWVREQKLGVVLPGPREAGNRDAVLSAMPGFDGGRCREFARGFLTFERTVPLYVQAYQTAIERTAR